MGYFDGLTDGQFKKSTTGEIVFYPWGAIGKGYILKSQSEYDRIRSFVKKYYTVGLPALILTQISVGLIGSIIILLILTSWYQLKIAAFLKSSSLTNEKFSVPDAYATSAKSHNLFSLIILELSSIGFVVAGMLILYRGGSVPIALGSIIFFGICSIVLGLMILKKIR